MVLPTLFRLVCSKDGLRYASLLAPRCIFQQLERLRLGLRLQWKVEVEVEAEVEVEFEIEVADVSDEVET